MRDPGEPTMTHLQGIQTVTVHVEDLDSASAFYQKAMGAQEQFSDPERGWATLSLPDGSALGLHVWQEPCKSGGGRAPGTVTGLVLTVDDAHAFAEEAEAAGGKLVDPIAELPWGPLGGTIADPSGNQFAFSEPMEQ